jgi:hypothetical protein
MSASKTHAARLQIDARVFCSARRPRNRPLPLYPDPHARAELCLALGEVHRQFVPKPSPAPQWLSIPERGLYSGIASFGSIGLGKHRQRLTPWSRSGTPPPFRQPCCGESVFRCRQSLANGKSSNPGLPYALRDPVFLVDIVSIET